MVARKCEGNGKQKADGRARFSKVSVNLNQIKKRRGFNNDCYCYSPLALLRK